MKLNRKLDSMKEILWTMNSTLHLMSEELEEIDVKIKSSCKEALLEQKLQELAEEEKNKEKEKKKIMTYFNEFSKNQFLNKMIILGVIILLILWEILSPEAMNFFKILLG